MSDSSDFEDDNEDELVYEIQPMKIEDYVNRRAGHVSVGFDNGVLVWAGYAEVPPNLEDHEYWPPGEVFHYSYFHNRWRKLNTSGDIPNRCSGAGGCLLEDTLYIAAGFHQVFPSPRLFPEDDEDYIPNIEISNRLWSLNLKSLVWKKHTPGGVPPLLCDKTTLWSYQNKVFVFGGFGPPPDKKVHVSVIDKLQYSEDHSLGSLRGWSNQLLHYDSESDKWVWPDCHGTPPCPRAAHSSAIISDKVYIFGGRHRDIRLNDLHCLDLRTMSWSCLNLPEHSVPSGRSWQSLSSIYTGKDEGGLLLYGGFDNYMTALSDCWKLDLSKEHLCWDRQRQLEDGPRLWHQAVSPNQSTVMIIGGLTNNILSDLITKHHAEKVLFLKVSPSSLLHSCLEFISRNQTMFGSHFTDLPVNLRKILEIRASGGA